MSDEWLFRGRPKESEMFLSVWDLGRLTKGAEAGGCLSRGFETDTSHRTIGPYQPAAQWDRQNAS